MAIIILLYLWITKPEREAKRIVDGFNVWYDGEVQKELRQIKYDKPQPPKSVRVRYHDPVKQHLPDEYIY